MAIQSSNYGDDYHTLDDDNDNNKNGDDDDKWDSLQVVAKFW